MTVVYLDWIYLYLVQVGVARGVWCASNGGKTLWQLDIELYVYETALYFDYN